MPRAGSSSVSGVSLNLASLGPKQGLLALAISQPCGRQTVEGIRDLILAHRRTQPFRRGRWHLQSAIAEVARRGRSRSPSRHLPAPEIRQIRDQHRDELAGNYGANWKLPRLVATFTLETGLNGNGRCSAH